MKNVFVCTLLAGIMTFAACSDEDTLYPAPTPLSQASVTTESRPGAIMFRWDIPKDTNYYYVGVTYQIPGQETGYRRLASIYTDSLLIDGLLQRYGQLDFTFQTFSRDGQANTGFIVSAQADAAEKTITLTGEKVGVTLTADHVFTDDWDGSNPVDYMLDNNVSTAFVSNWINPGPMPRYVVMDLQRAVQAFTFSYTTRDHPNKDHPKSINVYGSNIFDGTFDPSNTILIGSITSGLPEGRAETYTSPTFIIEDEPCSVIWLEIPETISGNMFYSLSEISVTEYMTKVIDPEEVNEEPFMN